MASLLWHKPAGKFSVHSTSVHPGSLHASMQVSGHVYDEEGRKVLALSGAWNSHLDMAKCDEEGDPLPDAKTIRLWEVCSQHPVNYHFGHVAFL